jgi:NAD(P)H-hydrate epimerase
VLTPHPGEAARLLDWPTAQVVGNRVEAVQGLAQRYGGIAVLKGAGTLIATSDEMWLCTDGNPGMAVGGMGDLLTGVIAALIGQGLGPNMAASLGVYVHARAGDRAAAQAGQRGLLPTDLLDSIRYFVNPTRP